MPRPSRVEAETRRFSLTTGTLTAEAEIVGPDFNVVPPLIRIRRPGVDLTLSFEELDEIHKWATDRLWIVPPEPEP